MSQLRIYQSPGGRPFFGGDCQKNTKLLQWYSRAFHGYLVAPDGEHTDESLVRGPHAKGNVERIIDHVDKSFLSGAPDFEGFDHLKAWWSTTAHECIHGACPERVAERRDQDATHLGPLQYCLSGLSHRGLRWLHCGPGQSLLGARYLLRRVVDSLLTLDVQLHILDHQGERVTAEHRLSEPATGWCLEPHNHWLLWAEALSVEQRDLGVYEEVAS